MDSPEATDRAVLDAWRARQRYRQGEGPQATETQRRLLEQPGLDAAVMVAAAHRRAGTYRGIGQRRQWS